jgi:hypothetical protein
LIAAKILETNFFQHSCIFYSIVKRDIPYGRTYVTDIGREGDRQRDGKTSIDNK